MREEKRRESPFAKLFHTVLEFLRPITPRLPNRESRFANPDSPSLPPEQFRRMLEEALADPEMARRVLWPLVGTVFPIEGGMPCTNAPCFTTDGTNDAGVTVLWIQQNGSQTAPPVRIRNKGNTDDILTLLPDGKLGIGKPIPGYELDVNGNIQLKDSIYADGELYLRPASRQVSLYDASNAYVLRIFNGATQAIRLASNGDSYLNGGNVGIGKANPQELLDVNGNIRCNQLQKIVFVQPLGSPNDDGDRINQAIDALPPQGGVIVLVPFNAQGQLIPYNIRTPVRNGSRKAVKLRGFGGMAIDYFQPGQQTPLTSLKWDPTVSGTGQPVVSFWSPDPNLSPQDFEISDLTIDGSGVADVGLFLSRISTSKFINVQVQNLRRTPSGQSPSVGIYLVAYGGTSGVNWNTFINCSVEGAARGVYLSQVSSGGNPSHNSFLGLSIAYYSEWDQNAGIWLDDCDNNLFERVWIYPRPQFLGQQITGYGVVINNPIARANYFYHLQACANADDPVPSKSLKIINAVNPPGAKNVIFGYDMENGEDQPVTDTGSDPADYLYWVDSRGVTHLGKNSAFSFPTLNGTFENVGAALYVTLGGTRRQVLTT